MAGYREAKNGCTTKRCCLRGNTCCLPGNTCCLPDDSATPLACYVSEPFPGLLPAEPIASEAVDRGKISSEIVVNAVCAARSAAGIALAIAGGSRCRP